MLRTVFTKNAPFTVPRARFWSPSITFSVPLRPSSRPTITHISTRNYATYKRFNGSAGPQIDVRALLKNRYFGYFAAAALAFYFYNRDEAPFTKRHRFLWVPLWLERKIGDYSYSQIMGQYQNHLVPRSDPAYLQVSRVMNRLLASAIENTRDPQQAAHLKSLDWTINIIRVTDVNQEPPNAFILPNGKIFIFSSILPICKNEDGLATVLAHELSHQLAHHSSEQLSKQPFYVLLSTLLYAATGISGFNDLLIAGFLQMPASRDMESEADRIGCELMARSCFDVHEAVNFWARMESFENRASTRGMVLREFLSTHPNTHKRVQDITSWMPELDSIRDASECHSWGMFQDVNRNFFKR